MKEEKQVDLKIKSIAIKALKIIATIILSVIILAGLITFPFVADKSDSVLLDAIIPFACLGGFCAFGIERMWSKY